MIIFIKNSVVETTVVSPLIRLSHCHNVSNSNSGKQFE